MNKHKLTVAAVALVTLLGGQAFADPSASAAVTMSGPSVQTCTFGALTQTGATNAGLSSSTPSAATVSITTLASPATAIYQPGTVIALGMSGMCNYVHNVSLKTTRGGLKPTAAQIAANSPVAGSLPFLQHIDYNAIVTWGGPTPTVLSTTNIAGESVTANINGSFRGTGSLSLSLKNPVGYATTPMIAGDYSDTLTVQIGVPL
jgi:hypothetical protein